jgi:hypothetical protein
LIRSVEAAFGCGLGGCVGPGRTAEVPVSASPPATKSTCLPELCLTGYGYEDAFHSANTHHRAWAVLRARPLPPTSPCPTPPPPAPAPEANSFQMLLLNDGLRRWRGASALRCSNFSGITTAVTRPLSPVSCHLSPVTCHLPPASCPLSPVPCPLPLVPAVAGRLIAT